jgi:ribonuclease HII
VDGFETRAHAKGFRAVAGVDEAGRGPLAGPVVAAAVILPPGFRHLGIRDSKSLTSAQRDRAYGLIAAQAAAVAVASASPEEVDAVNILRASLLAMARAVALLSPGPDFLYVDGNVPIACPIAQETLVGGDARCLSVMAASIVAKVTRDRMMAEADRLYPGYGFLSHKGYPTRRHLAALRALGPCAIHRKTFRGVLP